jgi:hypothetical protein
MPKYMTVEHAVLGFLASDEEQTMVTRLLALQDVLGCSRGFAMVTAKNTKAYGAGDAQEERHSAMCSSRGHAGVSAASASAVPRRRHAGWPVTAASASAVPSHRRAGNRRLGLRRSGWRRPGGLSCSSYRNFAAMALAAGGCCCRIPLLSYTC